MHGMTLKSTVLAYQQTVKLSKTLTTESFQTFITIKYQFKSLWDEWKSLAGKGQGQEAQPKGLRVEGIARVLLVTSIRSEVGLEATAVRHNNGDLEKRKRNMTTRKRRKELAPPHLLVIDQKTVRHLTHLMSF